MGTNYPLLAFVIVAIIAFAIVWEIFRTKCPACGKFFAREIAKSRSSFKTDMIHDHTHKTTVSSCTCKFCGHQWEQRYRSTRRHR